MNDTKNMKFLFQYASSRKFEEFDKLFSELEKLTPGEFWEAYLMRAQIKLYTTDLTIMDDLKKAEQNSGTPQFPSLIASWKSDGLNRFVVFPKASGELKAFLQVLPQVREKLSRWYGRRNDFLLEQLQGEICYFMGEVSAAMSFLEAQCATEPESHIDAIHALILRFRCYLAVKQTEKAHECMFDIIRYSKAYPECVEIYAEFRRWANLTTSWSGDSPRFYEDEDGKKQPVMADRLEGIKLGIARDTLLEAPFLEYAKNHYEGAYSLRQYYMDWFHAMYWLYIGDHKQTESYFCKVYEIATSSGILMPIIECGAQCIPLMQYMEKTNIGLFLDNFVQRTEHYEDCLNAYRLADA